MRSLRARVALIVVLAFIPAFVVVYLISRNDRTEARNDSADETRALAANVAEQYDHLIGDTRTLLRAIGSIPPNEAVLAQCDPALAAITAPEPDVFQPLHRRSGRNRRLQRESDRARLWIPESEWLTQALSEGSFVGLDGGTGADKVLTVAIGTDGANGRLVVAAQIALDGLASVVGSMESSSAASVTVVDEANVILFQRPDDVTVGRVATNSGWFAELRRSGSQAVVVTKGPDGVRRIYTGERLSEPRRRRRARGNPDQRRVRRTRALATRPRGRAR